MTALKQEIIHLVEQMPEEKMPDIIRFIKRLGRENFHVDERSDKMKAFQELEDMLMPVSHELDYDKELAEARDEKYGYLA